MKNGKSMTFSGQTHEAIIILIKETQVRRPIQASMNCSLISPLFLISPAIEEAPWPLLPLLVLAVAGLGGSHAPFR